MEKGMELDYNVSVSAIGQNKSATPKALELCTYRKEDNQKYPWLVEVCPAYFPFPSPGEVMRSEELFLEIKEANSLLVKDLVILELKVLEHEHYLDEDSDVSSDFWWLTSTTNDAAQSQVVMNWLTSDL